jgi:glycosyltransferase involved in cell wall biosynthesis
MSEPEVSVVISAKNRAGMLFDCFRGLSEQTLGRDRFEVVLIDNMSADPLELVADRAREELGLTLRYARTSEDHGPAPARNFGVSLAKAPIIAFTDSDCRPAPLWLEAGLRAFADPSVAMVTGPVLPKPGQPVQFTSKLNFTAVEHPTFPTANAFYRRTIFEANGGFDTSLSFSNIFQRTVECADVDLAWRIIKAGHARRFVPEAVVFHEVEDLGLKRWVLEPTHLFLVPALVRRHPELRSQLLTAGLFFHPAGWLLYGALIVLLLGIVLDSRLLLLLPVMLIIHGAHRIRRPRPYELVLVAHGVDRSRSLRPYALIRFCVRTLGHLPRMLVMNLVLLYGSVRFRCLVL